MVGDMSEVRWVNGVIQCTVTQAEGKYIRQGVLSPWSSVKPAAWPHLTPPVLAFSIALLVTFSLNRQLLLAL